MRSKRQQAVPPPVAPKPAKVGRELTVNPRLVAYRVLMETEEGRTPEVVLVEQGLLLSPRDIGLATALVYEILRHRAYLDWALKVRLTSGRAGPDLRQVLRLGLAQLFFFDRLGDHAVVSETVVLAKIVVPGRHGLVNAILRGLLRDRDAGLPWPPPPPETGNIVNDLALTYSCQPWLVKKLVSRYGTEATTGILRAGNVPTPPTLRVNPLRSGRDELKAELNFETSPTVLSPWGLVSKSFSGRPEDWPGYREGHFAVQDEASQLVGLLAGTLPQGASVLDVCAGLGGKALHLAALNPQARITAMDKDGAKLELLRKEALRLGCNNVEIEICDLLTSTPGEKRYQLVLIDAPCSGLGVIRRRPDLKWNKTQNDINRLAYLQLSLLTAAAKTVGLGGWLLYGVCSFSQEEGSGVVEKFLAAQPDFEALPANLWPQDLQHLLEGPYLTLRPDLHGTDGFFWACLNRIK